MATTVAPAGSLPIDRFQDICFRVQQLLDDESLTVRQGVEVYLALLVNTIGQYDRPQDGAQAVIQQLRKVYGLGAQ